MSKTSFALIAVLVLVVLFSTAQTRSGGQNSEQWQIALSAASSPPGYRYPSVNKFGFNPSFAATEEVVWMGSTTFPYPSSAVVMDMVSDDANDTAAGTGARTVQVYCLDSGGIPFSETLTLAGLTPVSMTTACLKPPYRAKVLTAGSGGVNAGQISFSNGGTTYQIIGAGRNQTETAAYTCPAGGRCVVEWVTIASDDNIEFGMYARPPGEVFRPAFRHQMNAQETQTVWWNCVPALTDLECRATSLSAIAEAGCSLRVHHVSGSCGSVGG